MPSSDPQLPVPVPSRPPWAMTAAVLTTFAALFVTEHGSIALPLFGLAVIASGFIRFRIAPNDRVSWLIRLVLVVILEAARLYNSHNVLRMSDQTATLTQVGEVIAALIVVEYWRGGPPVSLIAQSGMVMVIACDTFEDQFIPFFVAGWALFLALAFPALRPSTEPSAPRAASRGPGIFQAVAIVAALLTGAVIFVEMHANRTALTNWGMTALAEIPEPDVTTGISLTPRLGPTFGNRGTLTRALRIVGDGRFSHLRGAVFDTYSNGGWGPEQSSREFSARDLRAPTGIPTGGTIRITRLLANNGLLFLPLDTAGVESASGESLGWEVGGGEVNIAVPPPTDYVVTLPADADHQGPLCPPPSPEEMTELSAVPDEIDPRVRALTSRLCPANLNPGRRATVISDWLMSHHAYSRQFDPGRGDPVSNFILGTRGAHCEYFAAAAAIMLRCAGVPARYVVGYYAHEQEGQGVTVVRQRDAHAWAEAWIRGTGWVTVDATPSDGRPDRTGDRAPAWMRLKEFIQDRFAMATATIRNAGARGTLPVLAACAAVYLVRRWRRRRPKQGHVRARRLPDASPSPQVAALGSRFETICRRRGLLCPPNRPWLEWIRDAAAPDGFGVDAGAARRFATLYNAVRFGDTQNADEFAEMTELLKQLEDQRKAESRGAAEGE